MRVLRSWPWQPPKFADWPVLCSPNVTRPALQLCTTSHIRTLVGLQRQFPLFARIYSPVEGCNFGIGHKPPRRTQVSLEQFKTQVLLLHSQQSTLDTLSAGFTDRYSVHCATSGTEALHTLHDTPVHIIVSAQDLPGMSGLEALREARKRSPDTIGILLAGTDEEDGLEALVGDHEVFQIVRGE